MGKLSTDAFALYVGLASERSYEAVARHYGVTKRTVVRTAERECWAKRLEAIERKARETTDAKLADELHEMSLRHRKLLLAMASRAATAIQGHPLKSGMEGIKAAEVVIKLERLIAGEPSENRAVTVEQTTRDEIGKFLIDESAQEDWGDDAGDATSDETADEAGDDGEEAREE